MYRQEIPVMLSENLLYGSTQFEGYLLISKLPTIETNYCVISKTKHILFFHYKAYTL